MTSIKELSDSIGISKVAITKMLNAQYRDRLVKEGNKFLVPDDVADAVIKAYTARRQPKRAEPINTPPEAENNVTEAVIALLREQLAEKDKMIDRLQTQVENLQAVNADMTKAIRELNAIQYHQLAEPEKPEEPIEKAENRLDLNEEPKKRSFWDWLKIR